MKRWVCTHWLSATNTPLCKYSERSLGFKFLATCEAKYMPRTAAQKRRSNCLNQTREQPWLVSAKQRASVSEGAGVRASRLPSLGHPAVYDNLTCAGVGPMCFQVFVVGLHVLGSAKMCEVVFRTLF